MWFLALSLLVAPGEVRSEIKDDEVVVFYPTYAYQVRGGRAWNVPIHGSIFEPETGSLKRSMALGALGRMLSLDAERTESEIFKQRAMGFLVDNERGKTIAVRLGGKIYEAGTSVANGHFGTTLRLPAAEVERLLAAANDSPWLSFQAVTHPDDRRRFTGQARWIGPKGLSVISDVDDTIKVSMVTNRRELIANTFLRKFKPVEGMPGLYRKWADAGAAFHYLSGSPWQLYGPLAEFRRTEGFPAGSFHLKLFRLKDSSALNLFASQERYKTDVIERILGDFSGRRFILVGDSGEQDPEIYGAAARRHPDQVVRILIRDVAGLGPTAARFAMAFEGVPEDRWKVFTGPEELEDIVPPGLLRE